MQTVLEYIGHTGLVARGRVNVEKVGRLSKGQIIGIAEDLAALTRPEERNTAGAICTHCASVSLGGGRDECAWVGCRRKRLDTLARFAAFYSDRVFIRNFFCDYEDGRERSVEDLGMDLADDMTLILHIGPLLEKGLLALASEECICLNCLGKALGFESAWGPKFERARGDLAKAFLDRLSATAVLEESEISVETSCPKPYLECDHILTWPQVPSAFQGKARIMRRLSKGARVELSKTMIKALGVHDDLAGNVVHSAVYHAIVNQYLNASFLTNRELELAFLSKVSGDMELERRNAIAMKHLTAFVPFVIDIPVDKLSALRSREAESFLRFRSVFNKAIAEFGRHESGFSVKAAQQLYGDVLAPELARLANKVKRAKRDLISSAARPLVGVVGAISFGLLSGLIPAEAAQIAQAVGVTSFGSAFLQKLMALGDAERAIQQDDFYFLWKVKRLAKTPRA